MTWVVVSCNNPKKKSFKDCVNPTDKDCIKEIEQAKIDIANRKLVYCNYVGNIVWQSLRAENEMRNLLKKYHIQYQDEPSPCVIQMDIIYHCYCKYMQEQINEKLGSKFIDSLLYVADRLYILKHRDQVFDCGSTSRCWDIPAMFPGDSTYDQTNHSGLQREFEKRLKYPDDYKFKKGENSMAALQVYLDIDENGKAKVTNTQFVFWDSQIKGTDSNKKYRNYFKNLAISLIENTKWIPAKVKSIGVKSQNDIFIYLR